MEIFGDLFVVEKEGDEETEKGSEEGEEGGDNEGQTQGGLSRNKTCIERNGCKVLFLILLFCLANFAVLILLQQGVLKIGTDDSGKKELMGAISRILNKVDQVPSHDHNRVPHHDHDHDHDPHPTNPLPLQTTPSPIVEHHQGGILISSGKDVSASSMHKAGMWSPDKIIDGKIPRVVGQERAFCSLTGFDEPSWFTIDLGQAFSITMVKIFNGGICCRDWLVGATVHVSAENSEIATTKMATQCGGILDSSAIQLVDCPPDTSARFVHLVQDSKNASLNICEMQVFSEEDIGKSTASTQEPVSNEEDIGKSTASTHEPVSNEDIGKSTASTQEPVSNEDIGKSTASTQ